jgi:SAM-dependent methyltransferase
MADARTLENRRQWERKPALREVYIDLYRKMVEHCVPGRTLEIGGGSGNFKQFREDVISTDIAHAPWLDLVCDAQRLPFCPDSFANIVMFDVLHHIEHPGTFFREAERILRPGGRIVMVEPAITPVSWFFYHFLHEEPVVLSADPLQEGKPTPGRDPYASNQAIPTLIAGRHRNQFHALFPHLRIRKVLRMSLFAYPLTGGFKAWSLIGEGAVKPALRIEDRLAGPLGRLLGFRMLLVVERVN